jgi:hypothetical protein
LYSVSVTCWIAGVALIGSTGIHRDRTCLWSTFKEAEAKAKPYQVRQILGIIDTYKLGVD